MQKAADLADVYVVFFQGSDTFMNSDCSFSLNSIEDNNMCSASIYVKCYNILSLERNVMKNTQI